MSPQSTGIETGAMRAVIWAVIRPVRHGLLMAIAAMILGISWAGYLATHHEQLHGGFEKQESALKAQETGMNMHGAESDHHSGELDALHQHSHTGSPAMDAMQRLLRGHIHWMGLGILVTGLLLIVAFTTVKSVWKKALAWTFGIGALVYPVAWILMGFRTVIMGGETAEASVMWLFGPAAGLLLASLVGVFIILLLEMTGWYARAPFCGFFEPGPSPEV